MAQLVRRQPVQGAARPGDGTKEVTIAYWCILVAALLPYAWVTIAKRSGQRYNNRDPRPWVARQDNPLVQRAFAAHLIASEAFAPFEYGEASCGERVVHAD